MLKTCEKNQICTTHGVVTFKQRPMREKEIKSEFQKVEKSLYHIPTRNQKTGKIRVNTLLKKDLSPVTHINELGPQQNFVNYTKPNLQNAPIEKQIKADLDKLHGNNKNVFAEGERQIGTTALVEMTIDTGNHPPIEKKPYTLALKHYDWVKEEIDKQLEAGVIRESHSSWSAPIIVVPKGDNGKKAVCILQGTQ